jgi:threonine dehydratase
MTKNYDIIKFEYLKKNNSDTGNVLIGIQTNNINVFEEKLQIYNYNFTKLNNTDLLFQYLMN